MGLLWLSTVPLTNAIVAQVFGVRFLGMLSGLVFFSHQVGSFLGVWLGGKLFDATGSYNTIWGICILLGVVAALCHFPIDERSLPRSAAIPSPGWNTCATCSATTGACANCSAPTRSPPAIRRLLPEQASGYAAPTRRAAPLRAGAFRFP
jgi:MFS family permease